MVTAFRWTLFGVYLLLTIVLSHLSRPPGAERVSDVLLHTLEYGAMAVLLLQALGNGLLKRHGPRHLAATAAFGVLYGVVDEIHQYFVPGRFSSAKDAFVDALATLATVGAFALGGRLLGHRHGTAAPRVTLLTRKECHLCDDAREVLAGVLGRANGGFEVIDVDEHQALADRYGDEVPVVLVDGIKRFKGRVDARRLVRLLAERERLRRPAEPIGRHEDEGAGATSRGRTL